jgi:hypothetical protein
MKFLIVLAALIGGAWLYFKPLPPGQGPVAQSAMRTSSAVVSAVESYRSTRGMYPFTLDDLVPEFMGRVPALKNGARLSYERFGASYKVTFNYTNPLPVHCSHESTTPVAKPWACEWL